jgi:hypothetical protein
MSCLLCSTASRRVAIGTVLSLASLVVAGCGSRDLHRVSGRVTFPDGSPVGCGRVVIAYGDGTAAWGGIREDGRFTIGTRRENDGMRAGVCRVAVKDALVRQGVEGEFVRIIHKRFEDPATSGLEFTVPDKTVWEIIVDKP